MLLVALDIALQLRVPVARVRFWLPAVEAFRRAVLMPETSVDKDGLAARSEDQVRLTGKVLAMQPVAVAPRVKQTAHNHFRFRVRGADLSHVGRPFVRRQ